MAGAEGRRFGARSATRTPSMDHIAAYREGQLAAARRTNDSNALAMQTRILEATPFPDHVPAFRRMFVDHDGRLWVEELQGSKVACNRHRTQRGIGYSGKGNPGVISADALLREQAYRRL
jgi:hypothetical protein